MSLKKDVMRMSPEKFKEHARLLGSQFKEAMEIINSLKKSDTHYRIMTLHNKYDVEEDYLEVCHRFDISYSTLFRLENTLRNLFSIMIQADIAYAKKHLFVNLSAFIRSLKIKVTKDYADVYNFVTGGELDGSVIEE